MDKNIKTTDKIVAVYKLIVYESGKIETIKQPLNYIFNDLDLDTPIFHPSSRIMTNISVIEKVTDVILKNDMIDSLDIMDLNKLISKACYDTANKNGVTVQTVTDQISRQINLNKSQYTELLFDFYKKSLANDGNKSELKTILLKHSSKNNKNDDRSFINYSLTEISKNISLSKKK